MTLMALLALLRRWIGGAPAVPPPEPRRMPVPAYRERLRLAVQRPEYRPQGSRTFCNYFVRDVCEWFGWTNFTAEDRDQAGEMTAFMQVHPEAWKPVDLVQAAALASQGHLVIAGWINPHPQPPTGHVCVIAPEPGLLYSPAWQRTLPLVANVGRDNFYGKALSFAFTPETRPALFWYQGA